MKNVIIVEYIINLILLSVFYMHMFQLNSYFFKKHMHWMKKNIKKVVIQFVFLIIPFILLLTEEFEIGVKLPNSNITYIVSIILLAISILYNLPKKKSKIKLHVTKRVQRMFVTEFLIVVGVLFICGRENYILLKLGALNISAIFLYMIANLINSPIEYLIRQFYLNQAKKKLAEMPDLTVIGVTGSYGKTSVKNYLGKILSSQYEVLITPKNYNTTMGVVKTIRENLKPTHQIFICEMGATKLNDIKEICDFVKPKYGVITSIGPQHLESFKSIENVIKTKFELADSVKESNGKVFLNYDNEYIANNKIDMDYVTYGINNDKLDCNAYDLHSSEKGLSFKVYDKENDKEVQFETRLIGRHNITNLAAAISVAHELGIKYEKMVPRIREIESVEHRLQLIPRGNITIIDDSYNSNPVSARSAIDTLGEFESTKIIVTPGLIELGEKEEEYNYELGKYMTKVCDYIFLVGEEHSKPILKGILEEGYDKDKVFVVNSPQEAMAQITTKLNIYGKVTVLLENDLPDNYNL